MSSLQFRLLQMNACDAALEWSAGQESLATAWRDCQNGDWMLWLLGRTDLSQQRKPFGTCMAQIVGLLIVSDLLKPPQRMALADIVGMVEMWADRLITGVQLDKACDPDRTPDADKDPLVCRIIVELGTLHYCGNAEAGIRSEVCRDLGSVVAMLVAQVIALATPGRDDYPRARAATLAVIADVVRLHFPTPPVVPGLEP